ncbi:MAG: ATP-binding protein [Kordia sp.]|uniref:sensor histidine kinase n=1 Tax=Kordia sp. TaxID=1965332 RepID=UPI00385B395B
MNKSILYVLFFYTIVSFSQSNTLFQKTYTTQDGLGIDNIATLCFDTDGFLWLGGSNLDNRTIVSSNNKLVLQRFNGKIFHDIALPAYENPIKEIQQLYKRNDGKFYVVCKLSKGHTLLLFDPYTTVFNVVAIDDYDFIKTGVSDVVSYNNEEYVLLQKDRTISLIKLKDDAASATIFSFTSIENNFIMESSSKIIPFKDFVLISDDNFTTKVFDWNGNLLKQIDAVDTHEFPQQKKIVIDEIFIKNNTHYVFLLNNPNLYRIDETKKDIIRVKNNKLPNIHLNTYTDSFGNTRIIASNEKSISFHSFKDNSLTTDYQFNINALHGLKVESKNINNDVWIATNGKLHYFKFPSTTVKNFLPDYQLRTIKPLDTENILATTEDNDWFTINTNTHEVSPYKITLNNKLFKASSRNIILEDSIIWTNGNYGIIKVNRITRIAKSYRHYPIICLEKLNDSSIVYGTKGYNLMQFNTKTETHTPLLKTDSLFIYDIELKKHDNLIVAGTNKGLLTYDLVTKNATFYNNKTDLEDPFTLMLDYHKDYGYLLGSRSGTIVAFNPEDESFTTIYKDEFKAGIATILVDNDFWWINTFNGVVAFNPEDKTTTRFSEKDGFTHYEANRYSALKTNKGLFVGMIKGLNYFDSKALKTQKDSAKLTLLRVRHYNKTAKVFKDEFNRNTFKDNYSISLPSENRALDIDFGLKYIDAEHKGYTYKYRLNDKNWVELKNKNTIQFPNLAAGNYILEIEADDFSGHKIGESLLITINSTEFFYKKWWFFTLVSLSIIGFLVWLLVKAKERKQLQEEFSRGLIQSQEDERKRIAKELHDSISQQLTLIKKKAQSTNQDEITSLTHNTLEEVRAISRGLYPPLLKQLGFTESIEQLILDVDEQTDLFVSADIENIDAYFNEEQTLNCYRFIQECIHNCLKHAQAKALSVNLLKSDNTIKIGIQDNGKGFDVSDKQKQHSLGLKTMYERIRILDGELTIDSKPNKGTIIVAKIPLKNG